MIELQALSKTYYRDDEPFQALADINLHVDRGEIFAVIGPSGAGKSTLIRCVNLLERPTQGQVLLDGLDLTALADNKLRHERRKISMIFQHFNLLSSRNVYKNISLPLELIGKKKQEIAKRIAPLIALTGLEDQQGAYPSELSGGQKQRVAIARALATEPAVLLSDESTSALDPQTTHQILQLLKDINEELGVTIFMITHEMEVVKEICHHLAILEKGKVIEQATVIDFFSNPQSNIAKSFLRHSIEKRLPEAVSKRFCNELASGRNHLWNIAFIGQAAQEPLIASCVRQFNVDLNVLQANIEQIRDETVGTMLVEARGEEARLREAILYFKAQHVNVEVIGYVNRDDH